MEQRIGQIINSTRQNKGMTQEEFASRLGVTPQAVSKWERGLGMPDIALVEGICRILGISANELLGIASDAQITEKNDLSMQKEIKGSMIAEPILLEIGVGLISVVAEGLKTDQIDQMRKKLVAETGYLMPLVRIRDTETIGEKELCIHIYGKKVYYQEMLAVEPASYQAMVQALEQVCREHYAEILNKQLVKTMVDTVKELYPGVADELIPEKLSYLTLERILKKLIQKNYPIHDLIHIIECTEWEIFHNGTENLDDIVDAILEEDMSDR